MASCPSEDALQEFQEGRLTPEAAASLESHLDDCESCRALVAALVRDEAPSPPKPVMRLGRFVLLDCVGAGGMGLVYAAYDPELDRKVALKVLRPSDSAVARELRARLGREAQAMGRLSHPNVLPVFDVGSVGDEVFIVMEYVDGGTLADWLAQTPRSWREVVRMFVLAARGLIAAHSAGIVHGDFKPENVLVSTLGEVRVTDFGLARLEGTSSTGPAGTPRYQAPEQISSELIDARTDQFSFAVALYQALYGQHPFDDTSEQALRQSILEGRVRPAPHRARVPGRIRTALLRGLQRAPGARFPSLARLVERLTVDPLRRMRLLAAPALAVLAALGAAWGVHRAETARRTRCQGAERKWAQVWDEPQRARIQGAFLSTQAPYAGAAWSATERAVTGYVAQWLAMHQEACEATLRGEQSEELLDRRMSCLSRRLEEVRALTEVWTQADAQVTAQATQASAELSSLSPCADPVALASPVAPPVEAARGRVAELRTRLARVTALTRSAKLTDAFGLARETLAEAKAVGYSPTVGESWVALGHVLFRKGDFGPAREAFFQGSVASEAGADDEVAARAWIGESDALQRMGRPEEALERARLADAALTRGGRSPELTANLDNTRGRILQALGQNAEARASYEAGLALRTRVLPPGHPAISSSWKELGGLALAEGNAPEAIRCLETALALRERALGPDHPDVGTVLTELGMAQERDGRHAQAEASLERALDLRRRGLGSTHPDVATTLAALAQLHQRAGRAQEALAELEEAASIRNHALGGDHPSSVETDRALESLRKTKALETAK